MEDTGLSSSQTLQGSQSTIGDQLDLKDWPPIFVSATHFDTHDLHKLEEELIDAGAVLTYDIHEAEIILSKVVKKARILFDLRAKGVHTQEGNGALNLPNATLGLSNSTRKRKRDDVETTGKSDTDVIVIDDSTTESESEIASRTQVKKSHPGLSTSSQQTKALAAKSPTNQLGRVIKVARVDWFTESRQKCQVQPLEPYLTYTGQVIDQKPPPAVKVEPRTMPTIKREVASQQTIAVKPTPVNDILERAKEDQATSTEKQTKTDRFGRRKYGLNTPSANPARWEAGHGVNSQYAHLLQTTTTEEEGGYSSDIPEPPDWVRQGVRYACQRATPKDNPNDPFIALLKEIKLARLLTNDEIGVRAYSTSIASLAAYPHKIVNPREILHLPGCEAKIANLYVEWVNTGKIQAVEDLKNDEDMKVLRLFYDIWGVGATTALEFYYDRGWRELDDIVELGWKTLSRVQQIGVKYYDEFLDLIPRAEVEGIGEVIRRHAVKVRDEGIQVMLVGGYRRGKQACGDVDIVISHPEEAATANLAEEIVASLEAEEWITHTLLLTLNNSKRDQQTLPFRGDGGGHGFDSLDKALVVWQDPAWPTRESDLAANAKVKNPNIHRRVDVIISPWRTVGCAVVGWSGGTTFERDLRRYAKNVKSWKFDSSGVRDRRNGEVVDLEGYFRWKGVEGRAGRAKTMEEAERRIFEGFGLEYREPWDRCTG